MIDAILPTPPITSSALPALESSPVRPKIVGKTFNNNNNNNNNNNKNGATPNNKPRVALQNITNLVNSPTRRVGTAKKNADTPNKSPNRKSFGTPTKVVPFSLTDKPANEQALSKSLLSIETTPVIAPISPINENNNRPIRVYDLAFLKSFQFKPHCMVLPEEGDPKKIIEEYNAEYSKEVAVPPTTPSKTSSSEPELLADGLSDLSLTPSRSSAKKKVWRVKRVAAAEQPALAKFVPVTPQSAENKAAASPAASLLSPLVDEASSHSLVEENSESAMDTGADNEATKDSDEEEEIKDPAALARRLASRMKQISYGKNTDGYNNYVKLVAKEKRKRSDPSTPDPNQNCSKRSFDGQVRKWRRALHLYDDLENNPATNPNLRRKLF